MFTQLKEKFMAILPKGALGTSGLSGNGRVEVEIADAYQRELEHFKRATLNPARGGLVGAGMSASQMRDIMTAQQMGTITGTSGAAAQAPTGDIRIVIHPTANGHTITLQGDAMARKEWVCPDGGSIVDIIAVALAEFNLTK